jgi:hypothetical protein
VGRVRASRLDEAKRLGQLIGGELIAPPPLDEALTSVFGPL